MVLPDRCGCVVLRPAVVAPPVWMHVLAEDSVVCRPPMAPERRYSVWRPWSAASVVSGRSRGGWRWTGWRMWRSLSFVARWSSIVPERVHSWPWLQQWLRDRGWMLMVAVLQMECRVVSGTSGSNLGHCCMAVRARLRRWDQWLLGESGGDRPPSASRVPARPGPRCGGTIPPTRCHGHRERSPWPTPRPPPASRR